MADHIVSMSGYLENAFGDFERIVKSFVYVTRGIKYDTIIGTGISGALVVPHLARRMHKHFALVRKSKCESTYASVMVEGRIGHRWIFVDDTCCSGSTQKYVKEQVRIICAAHNHTPKFVGRFEYNHPYRLADSSQWNRINYGVEAK